MSGALLLSVYRPICRCIFRALFDAVVGAVVDAVVGAAARRGGAFFAAVPWSVRRRGI